MSTPKFGWRELTPGGGQPHLVLNQALKSIDYLAKGEVFSVLTISDPPDPDIDGPTHIIGPNPTGVWAGKYAWIASWLNVGGWVFIEPKLGMMMWHNIGGQLVVYTGESSIFNPWRALV